MGYLFKENPDMDTAKVISQNLTSWMEATPALDTFKKLSVRSGVGFGTVRRAKNGDGNITVEKLAAIAQAFGRQPAELLVPDAGNATGPSARFQRYAYPAKRYTRQTVRLARAFLGYSEEVVE